MQENTRLKQSVVTRRTKAAAERRAKAAQHEEKLREIERSWLPNEAYVHLEKTEEIVPIETSEEEDDEKYAAMQKLVRRGNIELLAEIKSLRHSLAHRKTDSSNDSYRSRYYRDRNQTQPVTPEYSPTERRRELTDEIKSIRKRLSTLFSDV